MSFRFERPYALLRPTLRPLLIIILFCSWGAPKGKAQTGPFAESAEASQWVAERVRLARAGRRESVRVPLVRRSDGWGCICPYYYIGLSTGNAGAELWIEPRFERAAQRPSKNMILLAEGYFTGRLVRRDMRTSADGPEEWIYQLREFRVQRIYIPPQEHDYYDEASPMNRLIVLRNPGRRRRSR